MTAVVVTGECFEDQPSPNMGYVTGVTGAPLTQAAVASISYSVFEKETGKVVVASTSLTVSGVIFDTLQTPAIWTRDTTGYNFRHDAAATTRPQSDRWYRYEYLFTLAAGGVVPAVFEVWNKPLLSS
jgi:hypothetical protein